MSIQTPHPTEKQLTLVSKIEACINDLFKQEKIPNINIGKYLKHQFNYNYTYLSNVFSYVKGITIINYALSLKINKAKELINKGITPGAIARKLNFCSVAHFSNSFKNATGHSPLAYKKLLLTETE